MSWSAVCGGVRADVAPLKGQCLAAYADAQELRLKGSLLAAREKLLICTQQGCPGPVVADCTGWLAEVDGNLSSVVFAVSDRNGRDIPDASVSVEGQTLIDRADGRALSLDPGTYTFAFEAPGYARTEQTVAMRQSEKNRIVRVELNELTPPGAEPMPTQRPRRAERGPHIPLATFILGGSAVAAAGTFVFFGVSGLDKKNRAERCQSGCQGLIDDGRRDYVIADIALGVAVAAATAAILVWVLQPEPKAKDRARAALAIQPETRALQLSVSGAF